MSDEEREIDWGRTRFDGSRHEQLRRARALTVRQRLEALEQLRALSGRLQEMPRRGAASGMRVAVSEPARPYRNNLQANDIVLGGCTPTPLAGYLKALGVLRLVSVKDAGARGYWQGERFVLRTRLDVEELERFFLIDYEPTPIIAPWNAGSGFYYRERKSRDTDPATGKKRKTGVFDQSTAATDVVATILGSGSGRLANYRNVIEQAKRMVNAAGFVTAPESGRSKDEFILALRAALPDECVQALDAGLSVTGERTSYPPLLGTGWNDGNLDFTSNFMQRLLDALGTEDQAQPAQSSQWFRASISGGSSPSLTKNSIGQFAPGQAGGPNASLGFESSSALNPWDFVLMVEGALCFAAAAVRRNADEQQGAMSYPFTVRAVSAGSGSLGEGDRVSARGELWLPLWGRPATYAEIRTLMAEGRIALGRKPARDALDFVRAVHRFGAYRGVQGFQRFGILKRFGKAFLATPLGRVATTDEPSSSILDDLDAHGWLDGFRRFTHDANAATRLAALRRRLEDRLFDLAGRPLGPSDMQALIVLLGEIQSNLSKSRKARDEVRPIPSLSARWVTTADDGTPAFRIACAIAGLRGMNDEPLPLRTQWFPVERMRDRWMTPDAGESVRFATDHAGRLTETMCSLLDRRLWLAVRLGMADKPLTSPVGATLEDVSAFLRDDSMDARIAALLPGLCLCEIPRTQEGAADLGTLPAAFGLLKLALTPDRILHALGALAGDEHVPIPAGMIAQLVAGNRNNRAVATAWRRLHASGLSPAGSMSALPRLAGIDPRRAAAALLIPLQLGSTRALARRVLRASDPIADVQSA